MNERSWNDWWNYMNGKLVKRSYYLYSLNLFKVIMKTYGDSQLAL
jgi:hypothetical protein